MRHALILWLVWSGAWLWAMQNTAPSDPEMSTHDDSATFESKVNLVLVPVVVRDRDGHSVGDLQRKDFQLFDKSKLQVISRFSAQKTATASSAGPSAPAADSAAAAPAAGESAASAPVAQRFVLYLFDDLHVSTSDLAIVQKAAVREMKAALQPGTRVAVFALSGRKNLDFTDDLAKLQQAVMNLRVQPLYAALNANDCPALTYYMADQIINKNNQDLLTAKVQETIVCANLQNVSGAQQIAQQMATAKANQVLPVGEQDSRVSLSVIQDVIRRLSYMPGTRSVVFVSPGFVTPALEDFETKVTLFDKAAQADVTIHTIDARGLYTTNTDASKGGGVSPNVDRVNEQYERESALAQEDVLAELADGTAGTYFHNSNDLAEGLRRAADTPEFRYLLGFSPGSLKPDGSFHRLKVSLVSGKDMTVQARRGYFAPRHNESVEDNAKEQIQEAVFSRDERHDLPVDLHTQFFKPGPADARLTVLARIDLRHLRFKKQEGRNRNQLTVVSVLFDNNGNYIKGISKTLDMRLRDETLGRLNRPVTVSADFDVKPGTYVVRLVVRDAQEQMAAENGAVDIP